MVRSVPATLVSRVPVVIRPTSPDSDSDDAGNVSIGAAEVTQAQQAATVGDDRIEAKSGGRVDPESWTHGSAEQRRTWFTTGRQEGDLGGCDTFARI